MFRGRRKLIALVAVGLTMVLVASAPADAKKKKKKKPAAQQGMQGSSTLPLPGGGVGLEVMDTPVTADFTEFDSLVGKDNAKAVVEATWGTPADVDLTIQIQGADGAYTDVAPAGADGASSDLGMEKLEVGRLAPAHYRLIVGLFAGAVTSVDWTLTFYNTGGKPGPAPA